MKVGGDSCRISLIVDLSGIFLQRTIFWDAFPKHLRGFEGKFRTNMLDFRKHSLKPSLLLKDSPLRFSETFFAEAMLQMDFEAPYNEPFGQGF